MLAPMELGQQRLDLFPLPVRQHRAASWHSKFLLPRYRPTLTDSPTTALDSESGYETASSICLRLLLATIVFLIIYMSRTRQREVVPAFPAQRMCFHCGRITPRSEAACLECGGSLTT